MSNFLGRADAQRSGRGCPSTRSAARTSSRPFPTNPPEEIETILRGVWENLGRVGAEFAHLDRMKVLDFERGGEADIVYDRIAFERFLAMRDSGKPTLFFAAHLANWEVPALAPRRLQHRSSLLYRRPNIGGGRATPSSRCARAAWAR